MPHSSGGGSHGGGSHGGSSHHSSGGGSSAPVVRSVYFAGSQRYSYYDKNHIKQYIYCAKDPAKAFKPRWGFIVFYLPFIITIIFMASTILHIPVKVNNSDSHILIEDNIGAFSDTAQLESSLSDFYEKTGVTPAVVTVYHESWINNYASLEKYAYDIYVNKFSDEKHWLVVYSVPEETDDGDFIDWRWEGMIGDDTSSMITENNEEFFTSEMQKNLTASSRYTVSKAIADTFDATAVNASGIEFDIYMLFATLFVLAFISFHAIFMVGLTPKNLRYSKAVYDPDPATLPVTCSYCSGTFIRGTHTGCPNCGAPLPPVEQSTN